MWARVAIKAKHMHGAIFLGERSEEDWERESLALHKQGNRMTKPQLVQALKLAEEEGKSKAKGKGKGKGMDGKGMMGGKGMMAEMMGGGMGGMGGMMMQQMAMVQ